MEELLFTKIPVVATLTAVFFLLTAAQTLHDAPAYVGSVLPGTSVRGDTP